MNKLACIEIATTSEFDIKDVVEAASFLYPKAPQLDEQSSGWAGGTDLLNPASEENSILDETVLRLSVLCMQKKVPNGKKKAEVAQRIKAEKGKVSGARKREIEREVLESLLSKAEPDLTSYTVQYGGKGVFYTDAVSDTSLQLVAVLLQGLLNAPAFAITAGIHSSRNKDKLCTEQYEEFGKEFLTWLVAEGEDKPDYQVTFPVVAVSLDDASPDSRLVKFDKGSPMELDAFLLCMKSGRLISQCGLSLVIENHVYNVVLNEDLVFTRLSYTATHKRGQDGYYIDLLDTQDVVRGWLNQKVKDFLAAYEGGRPRSVIDLLTGDHQ